MAWTYSGNPSSSNLDAVRFKIGDTSINDPLLQDEEINYLLSESGGSVIHAAILACEAVAAKFSRQADTSNLELRVTASQRAQAYLRLAEQLKLEASKLAGIVVGGRSKTEQVAAAQNPDAIQPAFKRGLHDFPGGQ